MTDSEDKNVSEGFSYKPLWTIFKFPKEENTEKLKLRSKLLQSPTLGIEDMRALGFDPYAVEQIPANTSLKLGRKQVCNLIAKASAYTKWSSSIAYLFVGTHSSTESYSQSKLFATVGTGSCARYSMDSGYPTVSSNVITWRSTFTSLTANFAWKEYSLRNKNVQTTGIALNRLQSSKGTKVSGETWTLQLQITVT